MKKMLSFTIHCLLMAGMLYAVFGIVVLPAAACSATVCDNLRSDADGLCAGEFGGNCTVGILARCDSSGWAITCHTPSGMNCGAITGPC
jgi:hypothetical protein